MAKREFEDSFAGLGRKIDNLLSRIGETVQRFRNRMATGGLFERFERTGSGPNNKEKLSERVADAKEKIENRQAGAKLVLCAFGAGAALVAVMVLVLVFGFGLFRGTGLTEADLERDAKLRQAADRARAEREGALNPAAMMQRQQQDAPARAEGEPARRGSSGHGTTGGGVAPKNPAPGGG